MIEVFLNWIELNYTVEYQAYFYAPYQLIPA